jgi:hypothetical protein
MLWIEISGGDDANTMLTPISWFPRPLINVNVHNLSLLQITFWPSG